MQLFQRFYGVRPAGIVHVGAHLAEEYPEYEKTFMLEGVSCVWIEPQPEKVAFLKELFSEKPRNKVIEALAWSEEGRELTLKITNKSASSSVFNLKDHMTLYPDIEVIGQISVKTSSLERVLNPEDKCDFLVLDTQGSELEVIKGLGPRLAEVKWIYTEVSKRPLYEGGVLYPEIKTFLEQNGFKVMFIEWDRRAGWGDALFIRSELCNSDFFLEVGRTIHWLYRRIYGRIPQILFPKLVYLKSLLRRCL